MRDIEIYSDWPQAVITLAKNVQKFKEDVEDEIKALKEQLELTARARDTEELK